MNKNDVKQNDLENYDLDTFEHLNTKDINNGFLTHLYDTHNGRYVHILVTAPSGYLGDDYFITPCEAELIYNWFKNQGCYNQK